MGRIEGQFEDEQRGLHLKEELNKRKRGRASGKSRCEGQKEGESRAGEGRKFELEGGRPSGAGWQR